MPLLRSGRGPMSEPMPSRAPSRALMLAAALALAGCAQTSHQQTAAYDPSVAAPAYHVSPETGRKPDLEDDGREAQLPPLKKPRAEPDDPREPWSPNYGRSHPVERAEGARPAQETGSRAAGWGPVVRGVVPADLPADLPADFRRKLASATGD